MSLPRAMSADPSATATCPGRIVHTLQPIQNFALCGTLAGCQRSSTCDARWPGSKEAQAAEHWHNMHCLLMHSAKHQNLTADSRNMQKAGIIALAT